MKAHYSNISEDEINSAKKYIKEYNFMNFKRSTDVHNFYDYIENHEINETLKIL